MQLGYIGLGKMGHNMVERLAARGHEIFVYDQSSQAVSAAVASGAKAVESFADMMSKLSVPRVVWIMVPHAAVDSVLVELNHDIDAGDIIVDGGNSLYKESVRRGSELEARGIEFMDVGVSGGPGGARDGACLMIGGKEEIYNKLEPLFKDIAAENAYGYMGGFGAGHFVKMVHNGIEYGMMQALAEGFEVMKKSEFNVDLERVTNVYNHRSVIESRLVGWLKKAYETYGVELGEVSGSVSHTGEGQWTVQAARELGVPVPIIEGAFQFRVQSENNPSYTGKVLSALRNMFGGHAIEK